MHADFLLQTLVLLGAIVLVVPLLTRLGLGSVPGYLIAGLLIGPPLLGWGAEYELIGRVAEFGVVFLLFSIGIELRPARLWVMRRHVFGLGSGQLLLCATVIAGLLLWRGLELSAATVIGLGLALSSTALVVQLLSERGELSSLRGRAAFAVLLLQDVAVAPLLMLVYLLGKGGSGAAISPAGVLEALATLAAVLLLGRMVWRRVLPYLAAQRNADILVAVALLLVLSAAWLMEHAGMSLAMGAFLAGVLLADSPFRHQVVADIQPFRGILLGLFFMTVGMSIERQAVLDDGLMLLALTLALMAVKAVATFGVMRAFRIPAGDALHGALLLSQTGEFALILFALAASENLISATERQMLYQVVVFSMLLTPLADLLGRRLARRLPHPVGAGHAATGAGEDTAHGRVIICGFGRVGHQVARLLDAANQRWIATDLDSETIEQARKRGQPVFYGDCSRAEILRALGVDHAALVLITLNDAGATERALLAIRQLAPQARVIARAHDPAQAHTLRLHGVLRAVPETIEYSLQFGLAALTELGLDAAYRQGLEDALRDNEYARLLTDPPSS